MRTNAAGHRLIKSAEGCRLEAYQCSAGVWTIGYGSTKEVHAGLRINQDEAERRLGDDIEDAEDVVNRLVTVRLTDNEFSALVSFVFNLGAGNFSASTLLKKLNKSDYGGAAQEFLRWNKAAGKPLKGLTRRRKAEMELFLSE